MWCISKRSKRLYSQLMNIKLRSSISYSDVVLHCSQYHLTENNAIGLLATSDCFQLPYLFEFLLPLLQLRSSFISHPAFFVRTHFRSQCVILVHYYYSKAVSKEAVYKNAVSSIYFRSIKTLIFTSATF